MPWVETLGIFAIVGPSFFWSGWSVPLYLYKVIKAAGPLLRRYNRTGYTQYGKLAAIL
ncbi:hypothetical protein FHW36_10297 [Chitinophaga polysaccharea]|uniref:Uncharacterized protein n=1 Tax=Chitinophaga polysaccharea TaxID=1293035 RepID=A0A561PW56_9BACT|nr:hypothetical protein [Chitinophaga polysaccharea]TWF42342.1 hypothetical protein FHW36_10297 [Chitinophaga polysaccharea]